MTSNTEYKSAGDHAIVAEFGNVISKELNEKVRGLSHLLEDEGIRGIVETVPTYRSLMIYYDPLIISQKKLIVELQKKEAKLKTLKLPPSMVIELPTLYGGEHGPDLEDVSKHAGLKASEVIEIHSAREYLIYMLGFTPGFPYLGGMDPRIAAPRLKNPRKKIRKGSVGIADTQTGIYSLDSPGGWKLIGWTPILLFDPCEKHPFLLKAGDYIKFRPIDEEEYKDVLWKLKIGSTPWISYPKEK